MWDAIIGSVLFVGTTVAMIVGMIKVRNGEEDSQ